MHLEELDGQRVFAIHNFLNPDECGRFISLSESKGYEIATIGYARGPVLDPHIRDNSRVVLDDPQLAAEWWERARPLVPARIDRWEAVGLSERFKFYRYDPGQKFAAHMDGRVVREPDQVSRVTFMVYLNGGIEGGETVFVPLNLRVAPEAGKALLFEHRILHEGATVISGQKYVLRTDVMYRRIEE
jgi:predicted 2-oxoglutarate/Fe(II)-dependent dioxygenase YbiX